MDFAKESMEEYNPYCELCSNCGEEGCCSHIGCFSALIENPKCKYGDYYVRQAIYYKEVAKLSFDLFDKLKTGIITSEQAVEQFKIEDLKIYEEVFMKKYLKNKSKTL